MASFLVSPQQSDKPCLLKVAVVGQRLGDATFLHDKEARAVREAPSLVTNGKESILEMFERLRERSQNMYGGPLTRTPCSSWLTRLRYRTDELSPSSAELVDLHVGVVRLRFTQEWKADHWQVVGRPTEDALLVP